MSIVQRRRGSGKQPGPAVSDDLVQRDFTAARPDEIWLTDITEQRESIDRLSVRGVKDVCSRQIVGCPIGHRMTAELADTALRTSIIRRGPSGTVIVHSDRGGQFRSRRYQRTLRMHGLYGSIGHVASAGDNAAMESFFALRQTNVLNRQPWHDRDQCHSAIITWVESTYNHRRRQRALDKLTPAEFKALIGYDTLAVAT